MKQDKYLKQAGLIALIVTLCRGLSLQVGPGKSEYCRRNARLSTKYHVNTDHSSVGCLKVFQGADGRAKTVGVHIYLAETRSFDWNGAAVQCRVLREVAFEDGQLLEISDNYFAQADDGTVYYFGEVATTTRTA